MHPAHHGNSEVHPDQRAFGGPPKTSCTTTGTVGSVHQQIGLTNTPSHRIDDAYNASPDGARCASGAESDVGQGGPERWHRRLTMSMVTHSMSA